MQVTEKAECATVLSSIQQERTHWKHVYHIEVLVRGWVRRSLVRWPQQTRRSIRWSISRSEVLRVELSDRSLKVSEEILNFMREWMGSQWSLTNRCGIGERMLWAHIAGQVPLLEKLSSNEEKPVKTTLKWINSWSVPPNQACVQDFDPGPEPRGCQYISIPAHYE